MNCARNMERTSFSTATLNNFLRAERTSAPEPWLVSQVVKVLLSNELIQPNPPLLYE